MTKTGNWHVLNVCLTIDWTDEVLRAAPMHNHEVSVRGGTEKLKMLASATYFGQDGIVKGTGLSPIFRAFQFRLDVE